jgi:NAD(P)-dependent dehydrogenase (short-subunit alcohol dehydrogenase family)
MVALQGDVTSKADLQRIADEVKARSGYVNVLIANAGISGPPSNGTKPDASIRDIQSYLWQPSFEDMLSVYGANVLGVYFTTVAFLELLHLGNQASNVVQRSQVIATSSISGFNRNIPHGFAYSSSKAAVTHLMKQMATFLAPQGIRSNVLAPGSKFEKEADYAGVVLTVVQVYPSEMTAAKASYETHEIPERRIGDEDDIAGAILFLASRAGLYCNGNVLVTDGGRLSVDPATY